MKTTRRDFLSGSLSAGLFLPLGLKGLSGGLDKPGDKILIVFQWMGGCDILNTLGPMGHSVYKAARPTLAIPTNQAIKLSSSSDLYLHPALKDFKTMFDAGEMAVIQGVGYPKPNYSHFQAMKYWYAADPTILNVNKGWLASYLDLYPSGYGIPALDIQGSMSPVFTGHPVPVVGNIANFQFRTDPKTRLDSKLELRKIRAHAALSRTGADPSLTFTAASEVEAFDAAATLQATGKSYKPAVTYPAGNPLNRAFQLMARYIIYGLKAHVYYFFLGGFDTHSGQATRLNTLLSRVGPVIKAFFDDLKKQNPAAAKKTILFEWSEFSRRVGENGNAGTDHGAATANFVFGPSVKGGLYGSYPDLSKLRPPYNKANLMYTTDFRRVLAEIIDKWLGGVSSKVLPPGSPTNHIGFLP